MRAIRNDGKAECLQKSVGLLQRIEPKIRLFIAWRLRCVLATEKHRNRSGTSPRFGIEAKIADHDHPLGRDTPLPADVVDCPRIGFDRPIVTRDDRIEIEAAARQHLFGHRTAVARHDRLTHIEAVQMFEQFGYAGQQNGAFRSFPFIAFENPMGVLGARRLYLFERFQYRYAARQPHFLSDRIEIQARVDQRPVQIEDEAADRRARKVG